MKEDARAFDPAALDAFLAGVGHNRLLGQHYHDHAADWVELAMPWQERLAGDAATGALSFGSLVTLLDNSAGVSVWLRRGGISPQVTIDLRTDILKPTRRGATIIARCSCYRIEGSLAFVQGVAYEQPSGDEVCRGAGTFMLLEEKAHV